MARAPRPADPLLSRVGGGVGSHRAKPADVISGTARVKSTAKPGPKVRVKTKRNWDIKHSTKDNGIYETTRNKNTYVKGSTKGPLHSKSHTATRSVKTSAKSLMGHPIYTHKGTRTDTITHTVNVKKAGAYGVGAVAVGYGIKKAYTHHKEHGNAETHKKNFHASRSYHSR